MTIIVIEFLTRFASDVEEEWFLGKILKISLWNFYKTKPEFTFRIIRKLAILDFLSFEIIKKRRRKHENTSKTKEIGKFFRLKLSHVLILFFLILNDKNMIYRNTVKLIFCTVNSNKNLELDSLFDLLENPNRKHFFQITFLISKMVYVKQRDTDGYFKAKPW